jgi:hypothetical protein
MGVIRRPPSGLSASSPARWWPYLCGSSASCRPSALLNTAANRTPARSWRDTFGDAEVLSMSTTPVGPRCTGRSRGCDGNATAGMIAGLVRARDCSHADFTPWESKK